MTVLRVTQLGVEVLIAPQPNLRVTQLGVEVLIRPQPNLRVTQLGVEVLVDLTVLPIEVSGQTQLIITQ